MKGLTLDKRLGLETQLETHQLTRGALNPTPPPMLVSTQKLYKNPEECWNQVEKGKWNTLEKHKVTGTKAVPGK